MACREATLLMEKKQEHALTGYEKLQLKFHLAICDGCKRYNKQTALLHSVLKQSSVAEITNFTGLKLSADAKTRISKAFDEKLKK